MQIAVGQNALVELYKFAALYSLFSQLVQLCGRTRNPDDFVGLRKGWLEEEQYFPVVKRGWDYLVQVALQREGDSRVPYVGYVQPIGAAATSSTPASSEQDFGTGAFLLAAVEMVRYTEEKLAGDTPDALHPAPEADAAEAVDVYDLRGTVLRHQVPGAEALEGLPAGVYIVGREKRAKAEP